MSSRQHIAAAIALVLCGSAAPMAQALGTHGTHGALSLQSADDQEWQDLAAAFEAEYAEWKTRVRATKGARERAQARREDPTPRYAEAFENLSGAGELHATFWLLDHLSKLAFKSAERKVKRLALYEGMIREHSESELLAQGIARLHADSKILKDQGLGTIERLTDEALEAIDSESTRDSLRLGLARCISKSREPGAPTKAVALLDELLEAQRMPAKELEQASNLRFEILHLRIGCTAPDFEGHTVDGEALSLSDFRGKVVVLDFFGFW